MPGVADELMARERQCSMSGSAGVRGLLVIRDVCPRCQSPKFKKNGHIHNGKQNHHCHDCGRQFVECCEQYLISEEKRGLIERLLVERLSLRGICRAVGVTLKWLLGSDSIGLSGKITSY